MSVCRVWGYWFCFVFYEFDDSYTLFSMFLIKTCLERSSFSSSQWSSIIIEAVFVSWKILFLMLVWIHVMTNFVNLKRLSHGQSWWRDSDRSTWFYSQRLRKGLSTTKLDILMNWFFSKEKRGNARIELISYMSVIKLPVGWSISVAWHCIQACDLTVWLFCSWLITRA